jgi:hypothetical protein
MNRSINRILGKVNKMRVSLSPKMQAAGCVSSLVNIGALVSGIYQGIYEAKGIPMDPNTKMAIKYGPLVLSGILGLTAGRIATNDGTLEQMVDNAPTNLDPATARGCAGCMPKLYPVMSVGMTIGFEYLGYVIGQSISKV